MKQEITVEEFARLTQEALLKSSFSQQPPAGSPLVLDIRNDDSFQRGTIPGALHVPVRMEDEYDEPDVAQILDIHVQGSASGTSPREDSDTEDSQKAGEAGGAGQVPLREYLRDAGCVYLLCHTGANSVTVAQALREAGYEACSIAGGYRAYLNWRLKRELAAMDAAPEGAYIPAKKAPRTRQQEIERSIIKKFRKQLWCRLTKAVREYELIQDGDKIAVCISGGKDSMLMAKLMQEIQRHGTKRFEIVFLCMNPGYNEENWELVVNNAKLLGIPLTTFESDIFDSVANVEHHPCYLCARMRRGYLYNHAKQLGCNKIALGHHYDDVIETILMGILYAGKTETMMPKLHSQNFAGMELIRPLYLIREADIKAWCRYNDLHFIQCACRFTETCSVEGGNTSSKRAFVKRLIRELSQDDGAYVEQNIFNCVRDINLRTVIGYHKDGQQYHFLDDYDEVGRTDQP